MNKHLWKPTNKKIQDSILEDFSKFINLKSNNDFKNIKFVTQSSIDDLINIIYYSHTVISIHTGLIVHTAASFNKKIVDIVLPENFNELDRWIPLEVNYKRFNIYNFPHHNF